MVLERYPMILLYNEVEFTSDIENHACSLEFRESFRDFLLFASILSFVSEPEFMVFCLSVHVHIGYIVYVYM